LYWPRQARGRRRQFQITRAAGDGKVHGKRTDGAHEPLIVSAGRLLAVSEDGDGEHYSFIGWTPRRYQTWACAVERDLDRVILILPEWHPTRPVRVIARLIPFALVVPGGWTRATADLSAPYPARLALVLTSPCGDPGRAICAAPAWPIQRA
jgi:hypothetical protein